MRPQLCHLPVYCLAPAVTAVAVSTAVILLLLMQRSTSPLRNSTNPLCRTRAARAWPAKCCPPLRTWLPTWCW